MGFLHIPSWGPLPCPHSAPAQAKSRTQLLPGTSLPGPRLAARALDTCPCSLVGCWAGLPSRHGGSVPSCPLDRQPQSPDPGGCPDPPLPSSQFSLKKASASVRSVSHPHVILKLSPTIITSAALEGDPEVSCPKAARSLGGKVQHPQRPFIAENRQMAQTNSPGGGRILSLHPAAQLLAALPLRLLPRDRGGFTGWKERQTPLPPGAWHPLPCALGAPGGSLAYSWGCGPPRGRCMREHKSAWLTGSRSALAGSPDSDSFSSQSR